MRLGPFNSALLALAVSACAQSEAPISKFETVTITEQASQLGGTAPGVPLPARKPAQPIVAEVSAAEPSAFLPRMPNLRHMSACDGTRETDCERFAD